MSECKGSVSPKLAKACIDGDREELSEEQITKFRSSMLTLLYSQQRENGHSKHGTAVAYEFEKSDSVGNETVETISEVRQGHRRHVNCV